MIIVLSTFPDRKSADSAAVEIVRKELAACVNIIKIENSVYRWKGKVESHPEYLLVIKSTKNAYNQLQVLIKKIHPHEVPEIIYVEVKGGNADYIKWVDSNTLSKLLRVPLDFKATRRASRPSSEETKARKPSILS